MPTGWRPADVKERYPISGIGDVYHFERYSPKASVGLKFYAVFQMLVSLLFMMFMFSNYTEIGFDGLLLFSGFIFTGIYGYTTLMDRRKYAVWIEVGRGLAGISWILVTGDWFGLSGYLPWGNIWALTYFSLTILGGIYFTFMEEKVIVRPGTQVD
jgi:drug/metabolite transporter (DMT)-like permease